MNKYTIKIERKDLDLTNLSIVCIDNNLYIGILDNKRKKT